MNKKPKDGQEKDGRAVLEAWRRRGVVIRCPESVDLGAEVALENIAPGVILHAGCRIRGRDTSIGPGSELGAEGPVTVDDCRLGHGVRLQGGAFAGSVFLDGVAIAGGAHVRPGCLLEEHASGGHTVGLKQTILMPFVTVGSLVNFCDIILAGGCGPACHSEVGSSFVHFNYTPQGDKATASLLGDVPRGVMLDQPPIFLGGQGGLTGPLRVEFGSVVPAGVICRQDILRARQLYLPCPPESWGMRPYDAAVYRDIASKAEKNILYIAQLRALYRWYRDVRPESMSGDGYRERCRAGALQVLQDALAERRAQIGRWCAKLDPSIAALVQRRKTEGTRRAQIQQEAFIEAWKAWRSRAGVPEEAGAEERPTLFASAWEARAGKDGHVAAVQALPPEARCAGTAWLQSGIDRDMAAWRECFHPDAGPAQVKG